MAGVKQEKGQTKVCQGILSSDSATKVCVCVWLCSIPPPLVSVYNNDLFLSLDHLVLLHLYVVPAIRAI